MTRHEFTAPDGSRRWCSVRVLRLERHLYNYPNAAFVLSNLLRRNQLLAPKPSGLRWVLRDDGSWSLIDGLGIVGGIWLDSGDEWEMGYESSDDAITYDRGTREYCARALLAAVRDAP
jgi:hypothetical protein